MYSAPREASTKTAIVTGANRGIGYAVAQDLVRRGYRVVLLARDQDRGERARRAISTTTAGPGQADLVVGDLDSVRTTRQSAEALLKACPTIDILIHNAGIWPSRLERNEDGLERAFAVNHLAPFLLNHLLEPALIASRARVVQVSAGLYIKGKPDPQKTPTGEDFHPLGTYPTTKLSNLLLMPLFADRWKDRGVTINALHPGVIRTDLGDRKGLLGYALRAVKRLWKSPEEGARPVVRLAIDPKLEGITGRYFHLEEEAPLAPVARDAVMARALWDQALKLSGLDRAGAAS